MSQFLCLLILDASFGISLHMIYNICVGFAFHQGDFREDNFNTAMQVLRDAGDSGGGSGGGKWDPRGRKGGTKGVCVFVCVSFQG